MLSEELKQEIQGAYRHFLAAKSLRPRTGQRLMIAHIARVLANIKRNQDWQRSGGDHLCVIEAGTGTGKTLGYALAAIPVARERNKTLVIATATVALQEQILYRDLPDILAHSGLQCEPGQGPASLPLSVQAGSTALGRRRPGTAAIVPG